MGIALDILAAVFFIAGMAWLGATALIAILTYEPEDKGMD